MSFAITKAHFFWNDQFCSLQGPYVHRIPPQRAVKVFVPVILFTSISYATWAIQATKGVLINWWYSVVIAWFASMGHFRRFVPTVWICGITLTVPFKICKLLVLTFGVLWLKVIFRTDILGSWEPQDNPPVFYCFKNASGIVLEEGTKLFVAGEEPLISLCTRLPWSPEPCYSRVRVCSPGEEQRQVFEGTIVPVISMLLLTLPIWAYAIRHSLTMQEKRVQAEVGGRRRYTVEKIVLWRVLFLPETLVFGEPQHEEEEEDIPLSDLIAS